MDGSTFFCCINFLFLGLERDSTAMRRCYITGRSNMRKALFLFFVAGSLLLSSCSNVENETAAQEVSEEIKRLKSSLRQDPYFDVHGTSVYDVENGCIYYRTRIWQDVKVNTDFLGGDFGCLTFFNYGGGKETLHDGYRRDAFVSLGNVINVSYLQNPSKLSVIEVIDDEKYGSWARVRYEDGVDILMTPMAYRAYKTRSGDDNLIFVQIKSKDSYLNAIFRGDDFACNVIRYSKSQVLGGMEIHSPDSRFWHKI